jgi:hypothetical protein
MVARRTPMTRFWDMDTGKLRRRIPDFEYDFFPALVYRPDGKAVLLYCGGVLPELDVEPVRVDADRILLCQAVVF